MRAGWLGQAKKAVNQIDLGIAYPEEYEAIAQTTQLPCRSSRPDFCDSPRQASPSNRLAHRGSGGLDRGASDMDRSPRQDVENSRPASVFDPDVSSSAPQAGDIARAGSIEQAGNPFSQSREPAQQTPPAGRFSRQGSLKQLLHDCLLPCQLQNTHKC